MKATVHIHFQTRAREPGASLNVDLAGEELPLNVLAARLQEVLASLYTNGHALQIDIHVSAANPIYAHQQLERRLMHEVQNGNGILSPREIEVLQLIMEGCTNKEIGQRLSISFETVKCHRKRLLAKTHAHNTAALVTYYHNIFADRARI